MSKPTNKHKHTLTQAHIHTTVVGHPKPSEEWGLVYLSLSLSPPLLSVSCCDKWLPGLALWQSDVEPLGPSQHHTLLLSPPFVILIVEALFGHARTTNRAPLTLSIQTRGKPLQPFTVYQLPGRKAQGVTKKTCVIVILPPCPPFSLSISLNLSLLSNVPRPLSPQVTCLCECHWKRCVSSRPAT